VSVPAAIQAAAQLHHAGRLRKAEVIYKQVLQAEPDNVDALHLMGLVACQFGNHETAVGLIGRAIKLNPKVAMFHNNLGQTYLTMGKPEEAITHCKEALALQPDFPEAYYNLAMALRAQGRLDEAIVCFEHAVRLKSDFIGAWVGLAETLHKQGKGDEALAACQNVLSRHPDDAALLSSMGILLRALGRVDDAIAHYKKAIALRPDIPELHNNLAIAYKAQGNLAEAAACYRRVLELRPNDESARHLLNAMQQSMSDYAPQGYVQETFDNYAEKFDQHLTEKLEYRVPQLLGEAVKGVPERSNGGKFDILDLGCGTGLMGVELRDISRRLVGIDLSPKMIAKARERSIYDQLVVGDLFEQLAKLEPDGFDLLTSADVFVYIGNLTPIFEQCYRILRPQGLLAFSVEALPDEEKDFHLATTGRYQQSRAYIGKLSQRFGFSEMYFAPIQSRKEEGKPVSGYLYLLLKQANRTEPTS
jgi:predicted TPR repeat methyltransferase